MKTTTTHYTDMLAVTVALLFVGGAAAIVGILRNGKGEERSPRYVVKNSDGLTFVYGAHA